MMSFRHGSVSEDDTEQTAVVTTRPRPTLRDPSGFCPLLATQPLAHAHSTRVCFAHLPGTVLSASDGA